MADIYATKCHSRRCTTKRDGSLRAADGSPLVQVERDAANTQDQIAAEATATTNCSASTHRHLKDTDATKYTDNAFIDCCRTTDEAFEFFDRLVTEDPTIFSKTANVAATIEGRSIPAYTLSTGKGKKTIYMQGLVHPREWHAGSTMFVTMAAFLDAIIRHRDATIRPVVDQFDWIFVPIVNTDDYIFTHAASANRLWRKNRRHISDATYGVNLNRNSGPKEFFYKSGQPPSGESYAGTASLSEPETAGLHAFLKLRPLAGVLDVHSCGGEVLRPFANQKTPAFRTGNH